MNNKSLNCQLKNGLRVRFVDKAEGEVCCIHLRGLAGSNYEKPNQIGCAHFLEHFLLRQQAFYELTQKGGKVIGITSRDDVLYGIKLLKKDVFPALIALSSFFGEFPPISESVIIAIRQIIHQEIFRHTSIPEKYITRLIYNTIYGEQRLGKFNTGLDSDVDKITPETLRNFQREFYFPANFVLVLSGHFTSSEKQTILQRLTLPNNMDKTKCEYVRFSPCSSKSVSIHKGNGLSGSLLRVNQVGHALSSPCRHAATILSVMFNSFARVNISGDCTFSHFSTGSYGLYDFSVKLPSSNWRQYYKSYIDLKQNLNITRYQIEKVISNVRTRILLNTEKLSVLTDFYSEMFLHSDTFRDLERDLDEFSTTKIDGVKEVYQEWMNQEDNVTVLTE